MRENANRGFCNGGRAPYGYIRVKVQDGSTARTTLDPDPKTAPVVQRIFRECLAGEGLKSIARRLNADGLVSKMGKKWGSISLEKILHNEAYTGALVWGKRVKNPARADNNPLPLRKEGAWPALIDQVIFKQAQAKLAARAPQVIHPRQVDSPYLLSGIIHCGKCGATMVGQGSGHRYQYYVCGNVRRKGREVCPSAILSKDKVEGFVINSIKG